MEPTALAIAPRNSVLEAAEFGDLNQALAQRMTRRICPEWRGECGYNQGGNAEGLFAIPNHRGGWLFLVTGEVFTRSLDTVALMEMWLLPAEMERYNHELRRMTAGHTWRASPLVRSRALLRVWEESPFQSPSSASSALFPFPDEESSAPETPEAPDSNEELARLEGRVLRLEGETAHLRAELDATRLTLEKRTRDHQTKGQKKVDRIARLKTRNERARLALLAARHENNKLQHNFRKQRSRGDALEARVEALEAELHATRGEAADPTCSVCQGTGECLDHSASCSDKFCALAGGLDDCDGDVTPCLCLSTSKLASSGEPR